MKKSKFSERQMIAFLKEVDADGDKKPKVMKLHNDMQNLLIPFHSPFSLPRT